MDNSILLSICIPTYNRAPYIKVSLERILLHIKDFAGIVEILVSDNCSPDNTYEVINTLIKEGNPIKYNRNSENLGMDGNFSYCFTNATGKYVWVLGDDDYLVQGALKKIIDILKYDEYGLIHLSTARNKIGSEKFSCVKNFLNEININITFISGNIVNRDAVNRVDFNNYTGTLLTQLPVYLNASIHAKKNIIVYDELLERSLDGVTNGGYNIFQVFITNYLDILKEFRGIIGFQWYEIQKYKLCRSFLWGWMCVLLVDRNHGLRFKTDNWLKIFISKYWYEPYFYFLLLLLSKKKLLKALQ